ncbi:MAG: peptide chain release factor N(5)-glutamine methyltransferase [Pseudohongiella sp.]|nr:peptide chain release factor N(5)-glutamine methyltransferase [Pseudohongiella sp.]MDO9521387.1 peptide chain release factor N(5)-glutamine methyltransferase [Pseudohongiella sp.]MDP2125845.1 peptide chain release factor N(5)-glutamine methyltransferase [Pseudohongiella sp.]
MTTNLQQAFEWALVQLQELGGLQDVTPRVDAEWLLTHVLQCSRSRLITHPDEALTEQQWQIFQRLIKRRQTGEPVAYITGTRGFWSLDLLVTPDVLIPRADTELLVEQVLALADNSQALTLADMGTGSGAIALAVASERPAWRVLAADASAAALAVAKQNAYLNNLSGVEFYQGDWCQALPDSLLLDVLVSNPPYIEPGDPHLLQGDLRFEPISALAAQDGGVRDLAVLTEQSVSRLKPGGWLLFEHGYDQGAAVRELMAGHGFKQISTQRDLGGQERVTLGRRVPAASEDADNE